MTWHTCFRQHTATREDAEDLLLEVFLAALQQETLTELATTISSWTGSWARLLQDPTCAVAIPPVGASLSEAEHVVSPVPV
jgi:hypothetical protein